MKAQFSPGDAVQTPLGKGRVAELRNHGRLVVDLSGRAVVFDEADVQPAPLPPKSKSRRHAQTPSQSPEEVTRAALSSRELDLHGLTVDEALDAVARAINDALLDDVGQLRVIHGRSGGRLRSALHRHLSQGPAIRSFRIDPTNAGVTIVTL